MIYKESDNGTKVEFFTKIYDDLTSGDYPVQIHQSEVRTIKQFTPEGLDRAIKYYNQKYQDRGKIGKVQLLVNDLPTNRSKVVGKVCENLSVLQRQGIAKVIISLVRKNTKSPSGASLDHSIPFVLTDKKLILMRDEHDSFGQELIKDIAKGLEVEFIQSSEPIYDEKDPKYTSIQGDHSSCHFIALGILKDLTRKDLEIVFGFKNGFNHLPKSLKYSQSISHIRNTLDEKLTKEAVKKSGKTAEQYAREHKKITQGVIKTRVGDKFDKFKKKLEEEKSEQNKKGVGNALPSAPPKLPPRTATEKEASQHRYL